MEQFSHVVSTAREAFNRNTTKPLQFRISQVKALSRLFEENHDDLIEAVHSDFKRPFVEEYFELDLCKKEIEIVLGTIHKWTGPENIETTVAFVLDKAYLHPEPYGVVLIIGSWNLPLGVVILPMLGAIAAGNCVIIKPSEKVPALSKLLSQLIPKYLDSDCFHVVNGGASETTMLLKERFDYIFYTGSSAIGPLIHASASKHLTPVTLELGGKSPVYIDDDVEIETACRRILWGKFMITGQACIAPDYMLCSKATEARFVKEAKKVIFEFYGSDPQKSSSYGRIIDQHHFERIRKFLNCGNIALGGSCDASDQYIAPTILCDVNPTDSVMKEEIFGPVLPILNVSSPEEAIEFINKREKPLALYVFSTKKHIVDKFLKSTSSGSVCVNDTIVQVADPAVPFGGVGMSGMGRQRGKYTFDTFSNKKSVLIRSFTYFEKLAGGARYPPYAHFKKIQILKRLTNMRSPSFLSYFQYIIVFLFGAMTVICAQKFFTMTESFHQDMKTCGLE